MGSCTGYVTMAESNSPPAIPDKSRSLRKTSVKKRLETEVKRKEPKSMKDRLSKKARLSKYLCPAPTILVTTNSSNNIEPMVEPSSSPPSYIYASPNLIYTEGEVVGSSPNSSCSFYSPVPSSPRDVNEISLHISLLDTRTQLVT